MLLLLVFSILIINVSLIFSIQYNSFYWVEDHHTNSLKLQVFIVLLCLLFYHNSFMRFEDSALWSPTQSIHCLCCG